MYLAASDQSINVHLYLYTICSLSGRYLHLCHQFLLTCGLLDDERNPSLTGPNMHCLGPGQRGVLCEGAG